METNVTVHALKTADTEPVILWTELVLDVKLDIKEQIVQRVFLFFVYWEIYIDFPFINLLVHF